MNPSPLSVAIVGFGGMGRQHALQIKSLADLRVVGTFDPKPACQDHAQSLGYRPYASLDEILADPTVGLVLIATPNHVHKDIAIQSLKAGKHVICEKPVTLDSKELAEILAVEKQTGRRFFVHQNRRWDSDYLAIKKIYDEGSIGNVVHIESRVQGARGIPGDWRQKKEFGGGMMLDWGVHLLDRISVMVKEPIRTLYCRLTYVKSDDADDGFTAFLTFADGRTATVEVGTYHHSPLPLWNLVGDRGSAVINWWGQKGRIIRPKAEGGHDAVPIVAGAGLTKTMAPQGAGDVEAWEFDPGVSDPLEFYRNVLNVLAGKAEPAVKNAEVMRVMKLMEAAFAADQLGQVLALDFDRELV